MRTLTCLRILIFGREVRGFGPVQVSQKVNKQDHITGLNKFQHTEEGQSVSTRSIDVHKHVLDVSDSVCQTSRYVSDGRYPPHLLYVPHTPHTYPINHPLPQVSTR